MERLSASRPLLLASGSPRRREILETLRIPFAVRAASVDEATRAGEEPAAYLERIVDAKLAAARADHRAAPTTSSFVLVADTSVIVDDRVLGKPVSVEDARAMIGALAGRSHDVWTRFAVGALGSGDDALHARTVVTRVTFRPLSAERIAAYAASGEGLDKAGAYAVQGLGSGLVAKIEGSYSNVVGLPACDVMVALETLGLVP